MTLRIGGVFLPYPSLALWVSRGIHGKRRRDAFILISADDDPELATPRNQHRQGQTVSAKSVGRLLNKYLGNPVRMGQQTLVLKTVRDPHDKILRYHVQVT
jgi:hypothetical protein